MSERARVKDVCRREIKACGPDETLAEAAACMWTFDCGIMPVVDDERRLLGVVTDRDICMAVATRDQRASKLRVREVMTADLARCAPDEDLASALGKMARVQVRRLPVVDASGALLGMLSIGDVLRSGPEEDELAREALRTLRAIHERRSDDAILCPSLALTR